MRWAAWTCGCLAIVAAVVALSGPVSGHHDVAEETLPFETSFSAAVWTGEEAIVFPGSADEVPPVLAHDPQAGEVRRTNATMPTYRAAGAAFWNGTHAFLLGGYTYHTDTSPAAHALRYDPSSETLETLAGEMPSPRWQASVAYDGQRYAYVFGGDTHRCNATDDILRYDVRNDEYERLDVSLPSPRAKTSAVWANGSAYVFGGQECDGDALDEVVRFTPSDEDSAFSRDGEVEVMDATFRYGSHEASAVWTGEEALVLGADFCSDVKVYDPEADTFSKRDRAISCREEFGAAYDGQRAYIYGGDESRWSDHDTIVMHPGPVTVPGPTRDLRTQTGPGLDEITLTWKAPYHDGESEITDYRIYVKDGDGFEVLDEVDGEARSFVHEGLEQGEEHTYEVAAVNDVGAGQPAGPVTEHAPREPDAPPHVGAWRGGGQGNIGVYWRAPEDDGGREITHYRLYRSSPNTSASLIAELTDTEYKDQGLEDGVEYTYEVTAVNELGESQAASVTETAPEKPTEPRGLATSTGPGQGEVTLTWTRPVDDGGIDIHYHVYHVTDDGERVLLGEVADRWDREPSFVDDSLADGENRTYRVTAVNDVGEGPASSAVEGRAPWSPDPVASIEAHPGAEPGTARLMWTPPANTGGVPLEGYRITRAGPSGQPVTVAEVGPNVDGFLDEGATPGTEVVYRVHPVNPAGEPSSEEPAAATTVAASVSSNARAAMLLFSGSADPQPSEVTLDPGGRLHMAHGGLGLANPRDDGQDVWAEGYCFEYKRAKGDSMGTGDTFELTFQTTPELDRLQVSTDGRTFEDCPDFSYRVEDGAAVVDMLLGYYWSDGEGTIRVTT